MPQNPDPSDIAKSYNIPSRKIFSYEDLKAGIDWAMKLSGPVLLHLFTNASEDSLLRKRIVNELKKIID